MIELMRNLPLYASTANVGRSILVPPTARQPSRSVQKHFDEVNIIDRSEVFAISKPNRDAVAKRVEKIVLASVFGEDSLIFARAMQSSSPFAKNRSQLVQAQCLPVDAGNHALWISVQAHAYNAIQGGSVLMTSRSKIDAAISARPYRESKAIS